MRTGDLVLRVAFIAISGCARSEESSGIPPGAYTTEMGRADFSDRIAAGETDSMYGTWTLHFSPGRIAVDMKGKRVVEAPVQVSGNRITFDSTDTGPAACRMPGTYTYTLDNGTIRFDRVSDRCDGRAAVLTTHPLRKKSP